MRHDLGSGGVDFELFVVVNVAGHVLVRTNLILNVAPVGWNWTRFERVWILKGEVFVELIRVPMVFKLKGQFHAGRTLGLNTLHWRVFELMLEGQTALAKISRVLSAILSTAFKVERPSHSAAKGGDAGRRKVALPGGLDGGELKCCHCIFVRRTPAFFEVC